MTHRPSGDIDASDSRTLKAPEVGRSPPSTRFRNPGPTSASGLLERDGVPPCQGVGDSGHRNWEPEVKIHGNHILRCVSPAGGGSLQLRKSGHPVRTGSCHRSSTSGTNFPLKKCH